VGIQHNYVVVFLRQMQGSGQAGVARTYDADVTIYVSGESWERRQLIAGGMIIGGWITPLLIIGIKYIHGT
jgi:hypothetical protein